MNSSSPGNNPALGHAEQEAQHAERDRPADQRHRRRNDPPGHHDAHHPEPRADPRHDAVAGILEQEVADEEDAGAPAIDRGREMQILIGRQRREADIHPVDVGDDVAEREDRNEPQHELADRRGFDVCLRHGIGNCPGGRLVRSHTQSLPVDTAAGTASSCCWRCRFSARAGSPNWATAPASSVSALPSVSSRWCAAASPIGGVASSRNFAARSASVSGASGSPLRVG